MPITRSAVVAVGGTVGAACRWAIDDAVGPTDWPWVLLILNVAGSFILGLVLIHGSTPRRELLRLGAGVGFCGGLTTFSSFAVAAVRLLDDGRTISAVAFVIGSVLVGSTALVAGMWVRHQEIRP